MESLSVFLPIDRRRALAFGDELPDRAQGAGLVADISGFVPLAEELTRAFGPERGVEELVFYLNQIYDALIAEVHCYGGSAISFSGDAITCWFDGDDGKCATAAALAMQAAMQQFANLTILHTTVVSLSVKVGVAAGPVRRFLVGDPSIQLLEVLAGTTLDRLAAAEETAKSGEVVLDVRTWQSVESIAQLREWRIRAGERFAICERLTTEITPEPWVPLPPNALNDDEVRSWILRPVYERLIRGQDEFLADLRPAVAIFLNFSGIDYDGDPEAGIKLDQFIRRVQRILMRYEGVLLELIFGDKGSYLYAVFGAPIAHEDDPARAVAAAKDLCALPDELDFVHSVRIGISRGRMRAGAYGSRDRLTYGVQGDEVNRAARLMEQAAPRQILVSERIVAAVHPRYRFIPLGSIQVKGKQDAFAVFQVLEKETASPILGMHADLVGRDSECALLSEKLEALVTDQRTGVVAIEGEAGIGKSRLVEYAQAQARSSGIITLSGSGDAIERTTPYFVWQAIFAQLFNLNALPEKKDLRREHVLSKLMAWAPPELVRLSPLLNAVLPLDFPENELTLQLSGQVRAENTHALLCQVLQHWAETGPLILFLEDAHWLDSVSWVLFRRVAQQVHPLLHVIVARSFAEALPAEGQSLLQAETTSHISLRALHLEEVQTLVAQSLGVNSLPDQVVDFISEKAEGNPFFSVELGYALRERGLIMIGEGECRLAPNVDLTAAALPDTVQGVITSRIDRLTPRQQLTLKVASVIGRVFSYQILYHTFPVESDRPLLEKQLQLLTQLDLTALEQSDPEIEYAFRHVIIQEVSYSLLLFAQRRELHRVIAEWYEQTHSHDLARFYGLLAHHWKLADVPVKAIYYLEQAGEQALRNFANAQAISFFEELFLLADEAAIHVEPERHAHWELQVGEAHANLSHYAEARAHIERGFALLGTPVPAGKLQQVLRLLRELIKQLQHRLLLSRYFGRLADQREQWLPATLAYERLAEAAYFTGEPLVSLYSNFRNLNLAEEVGPSAELGRGTAAVGALTGFIPLHRIAQGYLKRALGIAQIGEHLQSREFVLMSAAYYYSGIGEWAQVDRCAHQLIETAEQLGDGRRWQDGVGILMSMLYFQGKFTASAQAAADLHAHASRQQDLRYMARGIQGKVYSELHLGRIEEALSSVHKLQSLIEDGRVQVLQLQMELWGLLALILLHKKEFDGAVQAAQQALKVTTKGRATFYAAYTGYAAPGEVFLTLCENGDQSASNLERFRLAFDTLGQYARVFPIGAPRFQLQRGRYLWLEGKHGRARRAWDISLGHAQRLGMVYDQGLAHYEIARHLPEGQAARQAHAAQAIQLFAEVNALYDLERAHTL